MKIFFATQNKGKQEEFKLFADELEMTAAFPYENEVAQGLDVEETGSTFSENSLLKAQTFAEATGMISLADDSGLEVKSLEGFPGVKSARWLDGSVQEKNLALLKKMENIEDRSARYVGVLCLFDPKTQKANYFEGICSGNIGYEEKGESGFGYDPIFIPDGYNETFAQLGDDVKSEISHRALAMKKLKKFFS